MVRYPRSLLYDVTPCGMPNAELQLKKKITATSMNLYSNQVDQVEVILLNSNSQPWSIDQSSLDGGSDNNFDQTSTLDHHAHVILSLFYNIYYVINGLNYHVSRSTYANEFRNKLAISGFLAFVRVFKGRMTNTLEPTR